MMRVDRIEERKVIESVARDWEDRKSRIGHVYNQLLDNLFNLEEWVDNGLVDKRKKNEYKRKFQEIERLLDSIMDSYYKEEQDNTYTGKHMY